MTAMNFQEWATRMADRTERCLDQVLPAATVLPAPLHEGMRYAVLGGGKRVRPLLVYAAGELSGADPALLDGAACAVELIHAYSLVHDDLPCMDNDVLRRGKPTVHVAFGEANAMLVGDALQALAFRALAEPLRQAPPAQAARVAAMVLELADAAGSIGMAGGQAIDLGAVGQVLEAAGLQKMHEMKTGAMLRVSVRLGFLAGPVSAAAASGLESGMDAALETFAQRIGLAFQVVDDILDVEADSATLGKTAGKDQEQGKPTYVSMLGLTPAKELAARLHAQAHQALAPFGPAADRLRQVADLIVLRKS